MADGRRDRVDARAVALLLTCCVLWGLNQVATKITLAEIPPLMQAAARSLVAAGLVAAWSRRRGIALWQRDGSERGGLVAGALFAAEFACIFVGLQYTAASRMIVFIYLAPFVVALGMPFIAASERLKPAQMAGLAVAFAGVAWAYVEGFERPAAGPLQWLGDALGLAAALLWGLTTLVVRATPLSRALPEKALLWQLAVSGVALAIASPLAGETLLAMPTAASLLPLAFQTVVVTFASYLAWFWLVRHYPATRISAFTLLTPVFGLVAGVVLLHEPATPRLVVAMLAVACGIALVNRA